MAKHRVESNSSRLYDFYPGLQISITRAFTASYTSANNPSFIILHILDFALATCDKNFEVVTGLLEIPHFSSRYPYSSNAESV